MGTSIDKGNLIGCDECGITLTICEHIARQDLETMDKYGQLERQYNELKEELVDCKNRLSELEDRHSDGCSCTMCTG